MVCPCWPFVPCKTGRTKTATGHLYYAVFSVIYHCAVSFFFLFKLFLSSVGLSVLNIVILLFLKKKKFKSSFFYLTIYCMNVYCLWRAAKMKRLMQGHSSIAFILKVPKTISIILWLKKAPQPWEDNKLNWTQKTNKSRQTDRQTDTRTSFIVVIFY